MQLLRWAPLFKNQEKNEAKKQKSGISSGHERGMEMQRDVTQTRQRKKRRRGEITRRQRRHKNEGFMKGED